MHARVIIFYLLGKNSNHIIIYINLKFKYIYMYTIYICMITWYHTIVYVLYR